MLMKQEQSVRAIFRCRSGHENELCVNVQRGVPPELRCRPSQPQGYGSGNGSGSRFQPTSKSTYSASFGTHFKRASVRVMS